MSEQERYESQGRAHAALKGAKANVATITAELLTYAGELQEMSQAVRVFIADPTAENPAGYPTRAENLKRHLTKLSSGRIMRLIDELILETHNARQYQEQVDKF